ncbi:heavy metal translocating P-type ATPase [Uliginosibacterium flavum]
MTDYYSHRSALPEAAEVALPQALADLGLFDHPDFQQGFVRPLEGDEREADLILEGITCAACVWLNERHLMQLPGVTAVQVNYATRRARIRWHADEIQLSAILMAVTSIGYRAHPYDPLRSEELAQRERRAALWRLFVAGFGMMQVMMYALPVYISDGDMSASVLSLMHWASLLLTLPVVFYSAAPFFQRAWRDLRLRRAGMDVPVALGVGFAFAASVWATLMASGEVYFDSVSMFVFFLLGGRYLELLARQRATRGAETLGRLLPSFARRLSADGLVEERVPASQLVAGDRVLIRPGETIVVDGLVLAGRSEVNEAWLTGESALVAKVVGDAVLGGSLNGAGALEVEACQVGEATRLATIRRLMERAAAERPRIVEQADRVAGVFTLVLLGLAVLAGVYWWQVDAVRAMPIFVAVLVVSCPCALSLATPVALTVATDAFAQAGLLVTRGHAIETLAHASHFVFDKTGTLTTGVLRVEEVVCAEGVEPAQALALAAALETHSEHAIARAIVVAAGSSIHAASDVEIRIGQGVAGKVAGEPHVLGRYEHVAPCAASALPLQLVFAGDRTVVYLARRGQWLAALVLGDSLRPEAAGLVAGLRDAGCGVSILSGDAAPVVAAVASVLGVADARAGLTPEGKHAALRELQASSAIVAMVGDGINDAPVLAQAHVSIAMAGGTDLARNQADIVLLNDALDRLLLGRRLARKTLAVIRENLAWALAYNLLAIPAAMAGWVTPWIAGLGMGASSLLVVLNALRIARVK